MADSVPDAPADQLLTAFLKVHARGDVPGAVLYARGEALHRRLASTPPDSADWGRFLVALGELAAEGLQDDRAASRWFLAALESVRQHGDSEVGTTAGYDQGVLHERRGNPQRAAAAYHA
ncbi:MAG: hypothetical protein H0W72_10185, partial [Planctomycetes bacterium]|nr:hypothetical protein [Planctomycetota bacterium]